MSERIPAPLALQVGGRNEISIHSLRPTDADQVRRLAQLVDRAVPRGPLLVASSDGEIVAALSTVTGEAVSDPFRATGDLVELLRLRSKQLVRAAA
jgi:hypothetical protein